MKNTVSTSTSDRGLVIMFVVFAAGKSSDYLNKAPTYSATPTPFKNRHNSS